MLTCISTIITVAVVGCHTSFGTFVEFRPVLAEGVFPAHSAVVIRFLPKSEGDEGPPWAAVYDLRNYYQY